MGKPSEVIILAEDARQQQIIRRYLRRTGLDIRSMRFELPSSGSGEQWVRERFAVQVAAYRNRRARAETKLIIMLDGDNVTLHERLVQLDQKLRDAGIELIGAGEQVAKLIPCRNIETWILCLSAAVVDEDTDYKRTRHDWSDLIPRAAEALYAWSRANARVPNSCVPSLQHGLSELRRLDFSGL